MEVDNLIQSYNEIELDDSGEEEQLNKFEEEQSEEEEISEIRPPRQRQRSEQALHHLINNVLTNEQRTALRTGVCFFCHKPGHFYRTCPARKTFLQ